MDTSSSAIEQGQTTTIHYDISITWEMKPRMTPQKTSLTVNQTRTGHEV